MSEPVPHGIEQHPLREISRFHGRSKRRLRPTDNQPQQQPLPELPSFTPPKEVILANEKRKDGISDTSPGIAPVLLTSSPSISVPSNRPSPTDVRFHEDVPRYSSIHETKAIIDALIAPTAKVEKKLLSGKPLLSPKKANSFSTTLGGSGEKGQPLGFTFNQHTTGNLHNSSSSSLIRFTSLLANADSNHNTLGNPPEGHLPQAPSEIETSTTHLNGLIEDAYDEDLIADGADKGSANSSPHPCILIADENGLRSLGIEPSKKFKGATSLLPPIQSKKVFKKLNEASPTATTQHQKQAFLAALRNVRRIEIVTGIKRGIPSHLLGATAPDPTLPQSKTPNNATQQNLSKNSPTNPINDYIKPTPAELVRSSYAPVRHIRLLRVDLYIDGNKERTLISHANAGKANGKPFSPQRYIGSSTPFQSPDSTNFGDSKRVENYSNELATPTLLAVLESSLGIRQASLLKLEVSHLADATLSASPHHCGLGSLTNIHSEPSHKLLFSPPSTSDLLKHDARGKKNKPQSHMGDASKGSTPVEVEDILSEGLAFQNGTVLSSPQVPKGNLAIQALVSASPALPKSPQQNKNILGEIKEAGSFIFQRNDESRSGREAIGGPENSSPSFHPQSYGISNLSITSNNAFQMSTSQSYIGLTRLHGTTSAIPPVSLPPLQLKPPTLGLNSPFSQHSVSGLTSAPTHYLELTNKSKWVRRVCFICTSGPSASVPQDVVDRANAALLFALNTRSASTTRILSAIDCSPILPEILSAIEHHQQNFLFASAGVSEKHSKQPANEGAWDTIEEEDRRASLLNLTDADILDVMTRETEEIRMRFTQKPAKESPRKNGDDEVLEEQFIVMKSISGPQTNKGSGTGTKRAVNRSGVYNNPFSSHHNNATKSNFGAVENQRLQRRLEMLREPETDPFQSHSHLQL